MKELRDLAAGIHPAVLAQGGLRPALEGVADGLPVPVELRVADGRYRAEVETAVYFVVCEALTNIAKHAGPCTVRVDIREENRMLHIEVADTGRGGAVLGARRGLAGIHDRVAALGGSLSVDSASGGGTRLAATVPCG